ncbi:Hypothetical protein GLP15_3254 [Giardia lamblia P15]|uniref:Uncharacterized protein n=1 Tax=Giardia intestinalis (strain P15) TaxID=658858 RepID=E1EWP8_GIAIA|nr:Hypothetical protein GLP15_3254 [Giardia lamblia P15]
MRPNLSLMASIDLQTDPSGSYQQFQVRQFDNEVDRLLQEDLSMYRDQAVKQLLHGGINVSTALDSDCSGRSDEDLNRSRSIINTLTDSAAEINEGAHVYLDCLTDDQEQGFDEAYQYNSTAVEEKLLNASIPKSRNRILDPMYTSRPDVDLGKTESDNSLDAIERIYNYAHALKLICQKLRDKNRALESQLHDAHQYITQLKTEIESVKGSSSSETIFTHNSHPGMPPDTSQFYKDSYNSLLEKHKQLAADFEALRAVADVAQESAGTPSTCRGQGSSGLLGPRISKPSSVISSIEHQPSQLSRLDVPNLPERIPSHSSTSISGSGGITDLLATEKVLSSANSPLATCPSAEVAKCDYKQVVRNEIEIARLKLKIKTITDEHDITLAVYKDKLSHANKKNQDLSENVTALTETCAQYEKKLGNVKEIMKEMDSVKSNFNDLLSDYNQKCTQCDLLAKESEDLRVSLQQALSEGEKSRQECIRLSQGETEQSLVIEDKAKQVKELEEQLQLAQKELDENTSKLEQMNAMTLALQQQVREHSYQAKQAANLHAVEITNLLKSIEQLSIDIEHRNLFIYNMLILSTEAVHYTKKIVAQEASSSFLLEPIDIGVLLSKKFNVSPHAFNPSILFNIELGGTAQQTSRVKRLNNGYMIPPISDAILNIFTEMIAALGSYGGGESASSLNPRAQSEIQRVRRDYDDKLRVLMTELNEAKRFVAESAGREQGLSVALGKVKAMYRTTNEQLIEAQRRAEEAAYRVDELNKLRAAEQQAFTTKLKKVLENCREQLH